VRLVSLALLLSALFLPWRWRAIAALFLPPQWHTTAVTAKFLGPVGKRQRVIEDAHFALRSATSEGRRAAPVMVTMTTMAVFLRQTLWG